MINPWVILGGVLSIAGAMVVGEIHGRGVERTTWEARIEQARAEAVTAALLTERAQQKEVNDALQKQADDTRAINDTLAADLERLRNRPARVIRVPAAGGVDCSGANGAELARDDAEFLARYAALAAEQDAALAACHAWADVISGR